MAAAQVHAMPATLTPAMAAAAAAAAAQLFAADDMAVCVDDSAGGHSFVEIVMPDKQRAHVVVLRRWLLAPEHFLHPYPTREEEEELMAQTGLQRKQLKNWFVNARKRLWKPLMAKCGARFTSSGMLPPTAVPVAVAPKQPRFTSRYRGVCAERNKWRAQITVAGRKQFLGTFATQREAALAYDAAARRHHGPRAVTNFGGSHSDGVAEASDSEEFQAGDGDGAVVAAAAAAAGVATFAAPPSLSDKPSANASLTKPTPTLPLVASAHTVVPPANTLTVSVPPPRVRTSSASPRSPRSPRSDSSPSATPLRRSKPTKRRRHIIHDDEEDDAAVGAGVPESPAWAPSHGLPPHLRRKKRFRAAATHSGRPETPMALAALGVPLPASNKAAELGALDGLMALCNAW